MCLLGFTRWDGSLSIYIKCIRFFITVTLQNYKCATQVLKQLMHNIIFCARRSDEPQMGHVSKVCILHLTRSCFLIRFTSLVPFSLDVAYHDGVKIVFEFGCICLVFEVKLLHSRKTCAFRRKIGCHGSVFNINTWKGHFPFKHFLGRARRLRVFCFWMSYNVNGSCRDQFSYFVMIVVHYL